ncbi:unnamed protein product [Amoebophrya sp. A120]|nr:unnamed protein product [Amoebophrya sp. A120]|eukprot:GSA120T00000717001.1
MAGLVAPENRQGSRSSKNTKGKARPGNDAAPFEMRPLQLPGACVNLRCTGAGPPAQQQQPSLESLLHRHNEKISRALGLRGQCCVGLCGLYCVQFFQGCGVGLQAVERHFEQLARIAEKLTGDHLQDENEKSAEEDRNYSDVDEQSEGREEDESESESAPTPSVGVGNSASSSSAGGATTRRVTQHCGRGITPSCTPEDDDDVPWFLPLKSNSKTRLQKQIKVCASSSQAAAAGGATTSASSRIKLSSGHAGNFKQGRCSAQASPSRLPQFEDVLENNNKSHKKNGIKNPYHNLTVSEQSSVDVVLVLQRLQFFHLGVRKFFAIASPPGRKLFIDATLGRGPGAAASLSAAIKGVGDDGFVSEKNHRRKDVEPKNRRRSLAERLQEELEMTSPGSSTSGDDDESQNTATLLGCRAAHAYASSTTQAVKLQGNTAARQHNLAGRSSVGPTSRSRSFSDHMGAPTVVSAGSNKSQSRHCSSMSPMKTRNMILSSTSRAASLHHDRKKEQPDDASGQTTNKRAMCAFEALDCGFDALWVDLFRNDEKHAAAHEEQTAKTRSFSVDASTAGHVVRLHTVRTSNASSTTTGKNNLNSRVVGEQFYSVGREEERAELAACFRAVLDVFTGQLKLPLHRDRGLAKTSSDDDHLRKTSPSTASTTSGLFWFARVSFYRYSQKGDMIGAHQMCLSLATRGRKASTSASGPGVDLEAVDVVFYDPNRAPRVVCLDEQAPLVHPNRPLGGQKQQEAASRAQLENHFLQFFVDTSVSQKRLQNTKSLVFSLSVWRSRSSCTAASGCDGSSSANDQLLTKFASIRRRTPLATLFRDQAVTERLFRVIGGNFSTQDEGGRQMKTMDVKTTTGSCTSSNAARRTCSSTCCPHTDDFFEHLLQKEHPGLPGYRRLLDRALKSLVSSLYFHLSLPKNWIYNKALQSVKGTFDDYEDFASYVREFAKSTNYNSCAELFVDHQLSGTTSTSSTTSLLASDVVSSLAENKSARVLTSYGALFRDSSRARKILVEANPERCGVFFFDEPLAVIKRAAGGGGTINGGKLLNHCGTSTRRTSGSAVTSARPSLVEILQAYYNAT